MSDKIKWDERYDTNDLICGAEPSEFLYSNADYLPTTGLALDLAAGEGRNSVFLAERGLEVIALDISVRGLKKCLRIARERKAPVEAVAADLRTCVLTPQAFDAIVVFNYLNRELAPAIIMGLKPGGLLVFETMTVDTLAFRPGFNADLLLSRGELVQMFRELRIIKYREAVLQTASSTRAVASLVASKPD
jgi:SAM-dependent methyltransferase